MNDLYTPDGWLNFEHIYNIGAWLNVIIGARQVGKTYGALKLMLDKDLTHILLRRTTAETETITASASLSPYAVFEPEYKVSFFKSGGKICRICDYILDERGNVQEGKQRGILTSLTQIAHIRGFNGGIYSDLVYDEFIPEKGVISRATEGDAFLNAYATINGNRELAGRPPLRVWLLANSNNINNSILEALGLTDDVLYMRRKNIEELNTDKGVYILQPKSKRVLDQRKNTALMRQISNKSDFYGMAIENEFSYDASPYVKTISLKGLTPVWAYNDTLYCWERSDGYYICRAKFRPAARFKYGDNSTDRERLYKDFAFLVPYYYAGMILFSDLRVLAIFKNIFNIE